MKLLARVLAGAGMALVVTAATVGVLFFGPRSWLTLVPLAIGGAAVIIGFIARKDERSDAWRERARVIVESLAILGLAAIALFLVSRLDASLDVTSSQKNTLAEASVQVAKGLTQDVVVTAFFERDDRSAIELDDLISRYRRHTDRVTLRLISPREDPAAARAAGAAVVVKSGDRQQRVRFEAGAPDQEERLTNALRAIASEERPRLYVVAGHGERELADEGRAGLSRFTLALRDEGFEVVALPLAAVGHVPDDARAVIVAAPTTPILEVDALSRYLDAGGRALILLEPESEGGLASILASRGVQLNADVVIDGSAFAGLLGGADAAAGVAYARHPITSKIGSAMTHFVRSRSISENPGTPAKFLSLVQSGAEAWGETRLKAGEEPAKDADDIAGPLTLLVAIEDAGRIVVGGDATFITNEGLGLGANRDLALNAMLWLAQREDQISVRPRGRGGNLLLLTPSARERVAFALLYGIPTLLIVVGVALRAARRAR